MVTLKNIHYLKVRGRIFSLSSVLPRVLFIRNYEKKVIIDDLKIKEIEEFFDSLIILNF